MLKNTDTLKPHPINATIYDDTNLTDLIDSIQANGQLEPIICNDKNEIISGHRRYFSMVQMGCKEVEVRYADYENDIIGLIEHNRHRTKSVKDIVREAKVLEKELKTKLGGQGKRTDINGVNKFVIIEEMAKKLGFGLSKMKQLKSISNYEPELLDKIDKGELSVKGAYEIIKEKYMGSKKKTSKNSFESAFKKLLKEHQPDVENIGEIMGSTYPYNINDVSVDVIKMSIGITQNNNERGENDYYPTPPFIVDDFLEHEKLHGSIWEPACGEGHMSKSIENVYGKIISTDLIDRGFGKGGVDFLDDKNIQPVDNIITNPPFNLFNEFVLQAKQSANKKICMFGKLSWLEGTRRYKELWTDKEFPLKKVYQYVERLSLVKNTIEERRRGMMPFCWFVFEKGYEGEPTIGWIKSKNKKPTQAKKDLEKDIKRTELIDNLMFKQTLDSRELVMYNKLNEFSKDKFDKKLMKSLKSKVWQPTDMMDVDRTIVEIADIKPKLELVTDDKEFTHLRKLIHSFEWVSTVGRLIKLMVKDETTDKILGIITVGSDLVSVECRENHIGWTKHHKHSLKKLNHTAVVSSIVPTQPFGFNFLGGKLIASIATTDLVRKIWKERYNDELVGLTTTSLFGSFSMYNNLPQWKKCGSSKGKVYIKPDADIYQYWLDWVRNNQRDKYDEIMKGLKTGAKQKMLNHIFNQLGIKGTDYFVNQQRGVYFAPFYTNTNEFLRNEIDASELIMRPQIEGDLEYIDKWWKPKAINRYKKLMKQNRTNDEVLWYEDISKNKSSFNQWLSSRG